MQTIISSIEEDIMISQMKHMRNVLSELVEEVEARALSKDEVVYKVKEIEKSLKRTRQGF
jgi:hypothetical protein